MEEKRVAEYFVVAGLSPNPQRLEEYNDEARVKPGHRQDPIVDVVVINRTSGELPPVDFHCVEFTPTGYPADLNHGSLRAPEMYVCYRRGRDKPPLTDLGILIDAKEGVRPGCEIVRTTPLSHSANLNNSSGSLIFLTYRRAHVNAPADSLAVMDICVILANKSEVPPHTFYKIDKNLNRAMVGSDVFICYKKSMTKNFFIPYKPSILDRYPLEDHPGIPLPERVPMFCLPLGASLESWPATSKKPLPLFSTFVLTIEAWQKLYGASLSFFEEVPVDTLTAEQKLQLNVSEDSDNSAPEGEQKTAHTGDKKVSEVKKKRTVHMTMAICLLSRWPFFETFKRYLCYVYQIAVSGPHDVPIERVISHFLHEVPFPSPQRPRILVQYSNTALSLSQPEESPLPLSGASFVTLVKNMSADNCVTLLLLTLLENKILLHSLRHAVLTSVAEAVANMIFPFHWQCPYIPVCPLELSGVLSAPTPFLVGIDSRFFDMFDPPSDVVCVDLDANVITLPEDKKNLSVKVLPKKAVKVLRSTLERLCHLLLDESLAADESQASLHDVLANIDAEFSRKRRQAVLETQVQEAFLRFMATILKGYNHHLRPLITAPSRVATNLGSLFDINGFLKSRDRSNQKFFDCMLRTQLFSRFIEERSFVSDKDASLVFFDECTEKVVDYSEEPRILELESGTNSERTVFITPPDTTGLPPDVTYTYNGVPKLNIDLFGPRPQNLLDLKTSQQRNGPPPASPLTRRTKQEVKTAQRIAQKHQAIPALWAKCLLSHCYSLWFIHLPSYIHCTHSKNKSLRVAYDVLLQMQAARLESPDELCYRVLLQLCGQYDQPVLAVKVLFEMRNNGIQPNAITYGYYNKAVLESKWPSSATNAYQLWSMVRHVVQAIAQFKQALRHGRRQSVYSAGAASEDGTESDGVSRTSADSFLDEPLGVGMMQSHTMVRGINHAAVAAVRLRGGPSDSPADERTSTGGLSDKGYSSMTQDDQRSSLVVSSQDSIEALLGQQKNGGQPAATQVEMRDNSERRHCRTTSGTCIVSGQRESGYIVRRSTDSTRTLRGSTCSSAGLLMTSEGSPGSSFLPAPVAPIPAPANSHACHSVAESPDIPSSNHKPEAGEPHEGAPGDAFSTDTVSSSSLTADSSENRVSVDAPVSENEGNQEDAMSSQAETDPSCQSCVQSDKAERQAGQSVRPEMGDGDAGSLDQPIIAPADDDTFTVDPAAGGNHGGEPGHKSHSSSSSADEQFCTHATDESRMSDPLSTTLVATETPSSALLHSSAVDNARKTSVSSLSQASSSSVKSLNSPAHSIRTPVTENDPLGMFNNGASSTALVSNTNNKTGARSASTEDFKPGSKLRSGSLTGSSEESTARPLSPVRSLFRNEESFGKPRERPLSSSAGNLLESSSDASHPQATPSTFARTLPHNVSLNTGGQVRGEGFMKSMRSVASGWLSSKFTQIKETPTKETVSDFFAGMMHSTAVRSVQKGLASVKDSLLETWAIDSDSDDSDEYYYRAKAQGFESSAQNPQSGRNSLAAAGPQVDEIRSMSDDSGSCHLGSVQSLQAAFFNVAMEVELCSLSRCVSCCALLYDEEIMAGWSSDDSNLNTSCQFCGSKVVPSLRVYIRDYRGCTEPLVMRASQSTDIMTNTQPNTQPNTAPHSRALHASNCQSGNLSPLQAAARLHSSESHLPGTHHQGAEDSPYSHLGSSTSAQSSLPRRRGGNRGGGGGQASTSNSPARAASMGGGAAGGGQMSRSAEDLLDSSICDVVNDTPVPRAGRVSRTSTVKALEIVPRGGGAGSGPSSVEGSPAHAPRLGGHDSPDSARSATAGAQTEREGAAPGGQEGDAQQQQGSDQGPSTERNMGVELEPISVPYLSPLVLRKELENVIGQEGDLCLTQHHFLDEHPIIFWNLLWFFKRLEVASHLPGHILAAKTSNVHVKSPKASWAHADSRHVQVRAMWDNQRVHDMEMGRPMHVTYFQVNVMRFDTASTPLEDIQVYSKGTLQHVVSSIMNNEVLVPLRMLLSERRKQRQSLSNSPPLRNNARFRSLYRDVLFLIFSVLGRANIDQDAFDREFRLAYSCLTKQELNRLRPSDRPPNRATMCCRQVFSPLEL